MTRAADRELRAQVVVDATPGQVWSVLADVRRMPELSLELVRMLPMKPGGLRRGQWYLGVNRRGWVIWPTRTIVTDIDPERLLAWDTTSSGARWVWELEPVDRGTHVLHRRPVPRRLTWLARLFAALFLGGISRHVDDLEGDMARSVARLKEVVERTLER
jgi:uncharacterized protein YndB with AHSA1/START domain